MKAMLFAAGKGTRLKPLTDTMPKALVPVGGIPLLERVIRKLIDSGCDEVVINVHHFAQQIIDFLIDKNFFGIKIGISDERRELLNTGGGLAKAAGFFNDNRPVIVHNVDILSTIDLRALYQAHLEGNAAATLAVSERPTSRYLLFDGTNHLQGWINEATGQTKPEGKTFDTDKMHKWAFSGIHIISPALLQILKTKRGKFSIIDFYLAQCGNMKIEGRCMNDEKIIDVGKITTFDEANAFINEMRM